MQTTHTTHRSPEDAFLIRVAALGLRCAMRFLSVQDAEDVSQDVALECLVKLRDDRQPMVSSGLTAYVRTMVFRRIIENYRADEARRQREDEYARQAVYAHEAASPDVRAELAEMEKIVRRTIANLTPATRRVYSMVRDDNASYEDAANALGITRAAVNTQVVKAQRALRSALAVEAPPRMRAMSAAARTRQTRTRKCHCGIRTRRREPQRCRTASPRCTSEPLVTHYQPLTRTAATKEENM